MTIFLRNISLVCQYMIKPCKNILDENKNYDLAQGKLVPSPTCIVERSLKSLLILLKKEECVPCSASCVFRSMVSSHLSKESWQRQMGLSTHANFSWNLRSRKLHNKNWFWAYNLTILFTGEASVIFRYGVSPAAEQAHALKHRKQDKPGWQWILAGGNCRWRSSGQRLSKAWYSILFLPSLLAKVFSLLVVSFLRKAEYPYGFASMWHDLY
jgi:hypothetical protein